VTNSTSVASEHTFQKHTWSGWQSQHTYPADQSEHIELFGRRSFI